MAAAVVGCGCASQLFKVEYIENHPQVHLHFFTEDDEYEKEGEGRVEFVCHGCGDSILLKYDMSGSRRRYLSIRNRFRDMHRKCLNRSYENRCPDYRRSVIVLDVRKDAPRRVSRATAA